MCVCTSYIGMLLFVILARFNEDNFNSIQYITIIYQNTLYILQLSSLHGTCDGEDKMCKLKVIRKDQPSPTYWNWNNVIRLFSKIDWTCKVVKGSNLSSDKLLTIDLRNQGLFYYSFFSPEIFYFLDSVGFSFTFQLDKNKFSSTVYITVWSKVETQQRTHRHKQKRRLCY